MTQQWHDIIRERMQHHEEQPPQDLLRDIKAEMARRGLMESPAERAPKRVVPLWTRRVAAAAAIVALVCGVWTWHRNALPEAQRVAQAEKHNTTASQPAVSSSDNAQQDLLAQQGGILAEIKTRLRSAAALVGLDAAEGAHGTQTQTTATEESLVAMGSQTASTPEAPAPETPSPSQRESHTLPSQPQTQSQTSSKGYGYASAAPSWRNHQSSNSSWSVGTYYGGNTASNQHTQGVMLEAASPMGRTDDFFESTNVPNVLLGTEDIRTSTKHHQPIRMGVSVRYQINKRWSVQTGVTYSYLSSTFTQEHNQQSYKQDQRLHYVGVPVSASYNLMQGRRYTIYATAGGEAAKLVSGSINTTQQSGNSQTTEKVKESRPQLSVNAALGAEYRFSEATSVYVEPGVTRYINNGSAVENIYKQKPTNFSLNVGFRININK